MMGKCTAMPINDTILVTRGAGFIGANFVLSAAIRAVLERGRVGETYNIGGNSERRNLDVLTTNWDLVDLRWIERNYAERLTS
jgi:dTDP-D-glucose 4,6-dehydratase